MLLSTKSDVIIMNICYCNTPTYLKLKNLLDNLPFLLSVFI